MIVFFVRTICFFFEMGNMKKSFKKLLIECKQMDRKKKTEKCLKNGLKAKQDEKSNKVRSQRIEFVIKAFLEE